MNAASLIVRQLLADTVAVAAVVGDRVRIGHLDQQDALPALVVSSIGQDVSATVARARMGTRIADLQIEAIGGNYLAAYNAMVAADAALALLSPQIVTVNGADYAVQGTFLEDQDEDAYPPDDGSRQVVRRITHTYRFTYQEA